MAHDSRRIAEYILWLAREVAVTPMQLLKLVYISHGWMLGLHSQPLFTENAEAWQYGPVVPSVYHHYKKFGGNTITDVPTSEPANFLPDEQDLMQQVWHRYGKYNGLQLSALTHQPGTPWEITRRLSGNGAIIPNDLIEEHYRALAKKP